MNDVLNVIEAKRYFISHGDYIMAEAMRNIEFKLKNGCVDCKIMSNSLNRVFPVDQQIKEDTRRLILPFQYKHRNQFLITIDSGFYWDGASIPRFAWTIVGSPFTGYYTVAALVHDALYGSEIIPRSECDRVFNEIMEDWNVPIVKRQTMYRAVRWFGNGVWSKHTQELVEGIRKHIEFIELKEVA